MERILLHNKMLQLTANNKDKKECLLVTLHVCYRQEHILTSAHSLMNQKRVRSLSLSLIDSLLLVC